MTMLTRHKSLFRLAPGFRPATICAVVALGAATLATGEAAAQHYNVIGQSGPAVVVDTSVLDELGPPNNIGTASSNAAVNRFGPGVVVRTTRPASEAAPRGSAKAPPSRLLAVPALPGRPTPQIGDRSSSVVRTSASEPAPMPRAAPPPAPVRQAAAPTPQPAPPKPAPKPAATPPERQAITPAPPPAPTAPTQTVSAPPPPSPPVPPPAPSAPSSSQTASAPPPAPEPPKPAAAPTAAPAPPAAAPTPTRPATTPPAPATTQTASLPAAASASGASRLSFEGGSAALSDAARAELDKTAAGLSGNEQRLQVVAYAASQGNNTSAARRLSLSRALAVRSYLIDKGIRSTRIDVRAMGTPEAASGGPADRVDLVLVSQ